MQSLSNPTNRSTARDTIAVFWSHTRRYPLALSLTLLGTLITQATSLISPWYIRRLVDGVATLTPGPNALEALMATVTMIVVLEVIHLIAYRLVGFTNIRLQTNIMVDLTNSAFEATLRHSYRFFTNNFAGSLVRKINRLSRSFEDVADQVQFNILPLIITSTGIVIAVSLRSALIASLIAGWLILFTLSQYWFSRWKQPFEIAKTEEDSATTGVLSDAITNTNTIQLFTGATFEAKRFREALQRWQQATVRSWRLNEYGFAAQSVAMTVLEMGVLVAAVRLWNRGELTVGDFALLQTYLWTLINKTWDIGRVFRRMYSAFADAGEIVEIMNTAPEIVDRPKAKPLIVKHGAIEFKNVSFSFQQTRKVLDRFNLSVAPGERIALVGSSGAGKSTITKLLFRFYDIDRGSIAIDGQNIAHVTQESLREHVSLVPQEPILFHRTLMENIRYGRRDASDEDVIAAAKRAHCHEFISDLPNGYDTYVGERGVKLSGGERQRVAIARAILKNAPILVLDEATSSLDSESEALIQDALHELMKGKTVIVIAHRLSTIMEMDRIIVINEGDIVDQGTHRELVDKTGIYQKLWHIQAGGFIP